MEVTSPSLLLHSPALMLSTPLDVLPADFPEHLPTPTFQIGERVQWQPRPTLDFGIITGLQYAPAAHLRTWAWKYTVWLDDHSPSCRWVRTDTAWEPDLEPLTAAPPLHVTLENQPL
jgi:hypothetical protein